MTSAIIVAAGQGTRMGAHVDKLWLEVAGRPVIAHTWARFNAARNIDEIILVVRDGMQPRFTELARQFHFQKNSSSSPAEKSGRTRSATGWPPSRPTPKWS